MQPTDRPSDAALTPNDRRLLEEALRRAQALRPLHGAEREAVHSALVGALDRGRRDLFSLVRGAARFGSALTPLRRALRP